MKTCLNVIAALSIAVGLFGMVPLVFLSIPDWLTYRPGEMVITDIGSTRLGAGTDDYAKGYIQGDGRKAVFAEADLLRDYLGHYRLADTLESGPPPVVPVWYTDSGYSIARFGENASYPDVWENIRYSLRNTFLLFLPALLIFIYYGWQRWKHYFNSFMLLMSFADLLAQGMDLSANLNTIGL